MKNKMFCTLKVGYTRGIYGCSGEYFITILINRDKTSYIKHHGLYGSDDRVNKAIEAKGYKWFYIPSEYGKMLKKDTKRFIGEYEALAEVKKLK